MSHKSQIKMKINDKQALKDTLDLMGISYTEAEKTNGIKTECHYSNTISDVDIRLDKDSFGTDMKGAGFQFDEKTGNYSLVGDLWVSRYAKTKDGDALDEASFKKNLGKRYAYSKALSELQNAGFMCQDTDMNFTQAKYEVNFIKQ